MSVIEAQAPAIGARDVEVSRGVYQSFLVRARETGEQQSIDSTNARVISKATPPPIDARLPLIVVSVIDTD